MLSHVTLLLLLLLLSTTTISAITIPPPSRPPPTTRIGVTYTPISTSPPPETISEFLHSHHYPTVRLLDPTPAAIRAFSYTNISLLLSLPNHLLPSFSSNLSSPTLYLTTHVLPFFPRARIHLISLGNDLIPTTTSLLPALRNLHQALLNLGIRTIPVSTSFNTLAILTTPFPPARAEFREPDYNVTIEPLLRFLDETGSYFLVNVYPYTVYQLNFETPVGFALFDDDPLNFRDDGTTGVRYRNLFDMMVDSVIAAMAVKGYGDIPVIVTETGWPSSYIIGNGGGEVEVETKASLRYAEMYLRGLVKHLRSGRGTPLRKEGAVEAYIYQLFDGVEENETKQDHTNWGIMYNNMSMKYHLDLSGGGGGCINGFWLVMFVLVVRLGI